MKISEMTIKDRFDDLLEKITGIQEGLKDAVDDSDVDIRPELQQLEALFRRLTKLRDDVLKKERG
jgi:hypothetical protein